MIPAFAVADTADSRSLSRACRFTQARAIAPGTQSCQRLGIRSFLGPIHLGHRLGSPAGSSWIQTNQPHVFKLRLLAGVESISEDKCWKWVGPVPAWGAVPQEVMEPHEPPLLQGHHGLWVGDRLSRGDRHKEK